MTTANTRTNPCIARKPGVIGYKHTRCRCPTCTAGSADYSRRRRRLMAYGQWNHLTDAGPAVTHLAALRAANVPWRQIAQLVNVPTSTIRTLADRHTTRGRCRCRKDLAEAILNLNPETLRIRSDALIDPTGTRRRIQALVAIGWSQAEQARRVNRQASTYGTFLTVEQVTAGTARTVADLFDRLAGTPAPPGYSATRARATAQRKGWVPPQAWDDDTIDNPDAEPDLGAATDPLPDPVAVERATTGGLTWGQLNDAERTQAVQRLNDSGLSLNATCLRLAVSTRQYHRWVADGHNTQQVAA